MAPGNQPSPIDTLFQTYDRGLYKITGSEEEDSIMDMIDSNDPTQNLSSSTTLDPSSIGSGVMTATMQTSTGSNQQGKKLFTDTVEGYILGVDPADGLAKFAIGNASSFFQWDGTNVTITGSITASSATLTSLTLSDSISTIVLQGNVMALGFQAVLSITTTTANPNGIVINAGLGIGLVIGGITATSISSPLQISNAGLGSTIISNSNSNSGETLQLQNNAPNGIPVINLFQTGVTSTHFSCFFRLGGVADTNYIWYSNNGSTPNGNLTGTQGDLCINGPGGHLFWCSGGTTWTQL